jgi:hypothetical protein
MPGQLAVAADATFTPGAITAKIDTLKELKPDHEKQVKRVPSSDDVISDVRIEIRDPALLDKFRKDHVLNFSLDPVESAKDAVFRPQNISGKGNIHVEKVRPRLLGTAGPRTVIMRTTQRGKSRQILDTVDRTFEHPNVDFDFSWDLGQTPHDYGSGAMGEFDISGAFVGPGLFGTWKLVLTGDEANRDIDKALTSLTCIQIEFVCQYNSENDNA